MLSAQVVKPDSLHNTKVIQAGDVFVNDSHMSYFANPRFRQESLLEGKEFADTAMVIIKKQNEINEKLNIKYETLRTVTYVTFGVVAGIIIWESVR